MRGKALASTLLLAMALLASGCATYVRDRVADAGNIFTATVGTGIGVTAKAGPIHTGLGYGIEFGKELTFHDFAVYLHKGEKGWKCAK